VIRRSILFAFIPLTIMACLGQSAQAENKQKKQLKALMITQSAGFRHGSVNRGDQELAPAEIAMVQLGQSMGHLTVHCSQDCASDFTKENLQNYDLVFFYTTGKLPIKEEDLDYFLNDWLKQDGHGFVGFHSATDTFKNYRPYWNMIGGTFNGHPWNSRTTVTISVHNPDFPAMKVWGDEFQIKDEIYQYKNWQPEKVHVLMSLNMAKCQPSKPYLVPVSWAKEWDQGRIYYTNLGHNKGTWTNPKFLESTKQGILWAAGLIDAPAKPNPELSQKLEKKAQADANQ